MSAWVVVVWVQSLLAGSIKIVGALELHPPFFLLLVMLSIGVVIALNYSWVSTKLRTRRRRFQMLHPKLIAVLNEKDSLLSNFDNTGLLKRVRLNSLLISLRKLDVECPELDDDELVGFLEEMAVLR